MSPGIGELGFIFGGWGVIRRYIAVLKLENRVITCGSKVENEAEELCDCTAFYFLPVA